MESVTIFFNDLFFVLISPSVSAFVNRYSLLILSGFLLLHSTHFESIFKKTLTILLLGKECNLFSTDHVEVGKTIPNLARACMYVRETTQTFTRVTYPVISGMIPWWSRDAVHVCTKMRKQDYDLMFSAT